MMGSHLIDSPRIADGADIPSVKYNVVDNLCVHDKQLPWAGFAALGRSIQLMYQPLTE